MVEAQVVFGALEVVLDVPARAAQAQAAGFGGRAVEVAPGNNGKVPWRPEASRPPANISLTGRGVL